MKFGVSFGDAPVSRSLEIVQLAEQSGFDQGWAWDSHILWTECFSLLGYLAAKTSRLELGTCVTNPRTRDATVLASAFATLQEMTGGRRVLCGIGRGDSAVRLMNRRPARIADLERTIEIIRALTAGKGVEIEGTSVQIEWTTGQVPIYVAAYGPKALHLTGRFADGLILQIADPSFIEWAMQFVKAGADEAGRDLSEITIQCAVVCAISDDLDDAREQCRWYPAMVGNHIADALRHHPAEQIPAEFHDYLEQRSAYDYREHTELGTEHSQYVPDEIVDRFCLIGNVEDVRSKLRQLATLGVGELNLYPHVRDFESVVETFGHEITPSFQR